ncbi:MAG: hypothetical protein ACJAUH_003140 [Saprospiraceae bacterium]|jgi:hypothetical protein
MKNEMNGYSNRKKNLTIEPILNPFLKGEIERGFTKKMMDKS